jgi:hypothetical protein
MSDSAFYFAIGFNASECQAHIREKYKDPEFAKKYPAKQTVISLYSPEQIRGYTIQHGCFCGNWRENPHIVEIISLLIHCANNDETRKKLKDIWEQWNTWKGA